MDMEARNISASAGHSTQPRSSVLRQALRDQSRLAYHGAILAAAETIILRDGFKRTKMVDVAEATGVSVGTLYNYFDNKEAVLLAIMEHHYMRLEVQLDLPLESEDPVQRVIQTLARVHDFIEGNRELFQLYSRSELARLEASNATAALSPNAVLERVDPRILEMLKQCLRMGRIRCDIPLQELAWSLRSLLHALLTEWYRNPDGFRLSQRGTQLASLFFAGASLESTRHPLHTEHLPRT